MSILELKNDVIKKLDLLEKNQLTEVSGIVSNLINGLYDEKSIHTLSGIRKGRHRLSNK